MGIVVGHSAQVYRCNKKYGGACKPGYVHTEYAYRGGRYILSGDLQKARGKISHPVNSACPDGTVWRLDIAMSRAFDDLNTVTEEPYARLPATLNILKNSQTRVIVSAKSIDRNLHTVVNHGGIQAYFHNLGIQQKQ